MVGPFGEVLVMDWGVAKILEEVTLPGRRVDAPPSAARPSQATTSTSGPGSPGPGAPTLAETRPPGGAQTHPGTVLGTPGYMPPEQAEGAIDQVDHRSDVFALGVILRGLLEETAARAPRPLAAIISKAQAPDPESRYPSVERLAADISRFLANRAVSAYRETIWERVGRGLYKYRTPIVLVLVYVVMRLLILFVAGT
jgi:serine/threonine protein kinase